MAPERSIEYDFTVVPGPDPEHWLHRYTAQEWLNAALNELRATVDAVGRHDMRAGAAGARRAAGMALNGALVVVPNASWGRTYVEHLQALAAPAEARALGSVDATAADASKGAYSSEPPSALPVVPPAVTAAAKELLEAQAQSGVLITLQSPRAGHALLDATRTVMAHAYALIHGDTGKPHDT